MQNSFFFDSYNYGEDLNAETDTGSVSNLFMHCISRTKYCCVCAMVMTYILNDVQYTGCMCCLECRIRLLLFILNNYSKAGWLSNQRAFKIKFSKLFLQ